MSVSLRLTYGWPRAAPDAVTARQLLEGTPTWEQGVEPLVVYSCEGVFSRSPQGFRDSKRLVRRVRQLSGEAGVPIECQCDVFAYLFLAAAKNGDLLHPVDRDEPFADPAYQKGLQRCLFEQRQLARLESHGIAPRTRGLLKRYLAAREVLARPSCRDERRIVATMLVSGPSTVEELAKGLGIWPDLVDRCLFVLQGHGCIVCDDTQERHFRISPEAIATNAFLIQSTLGFSVTDPLEHCLGIAG